MSFELDTKVDLLRAKSVVLGGRDLKIAPLTLRKIISAAGLLRGITDAGNALPDEMVGRLLDFVMLGLSRTYPQLTKDELLDSEITVAELRTAADVVIEQSGGVKKDAGVGELTAMGASGGERSSPNSALN